MSSIKEGDLKRELGIWDVITNVLSISIGSGIFLLPALVYVILGPASITAYIYCGLIFLALGLCFGEVSSRIPDTGGLYVYIERAFGPLAGFVANILYSIGVAAMACAALLNAMADIASAIFPIFEEFWARGLLFLGIMSLISVVSYRGVRDSMTLIKTLTGIKVLAILSLVIFGLSSVQIDNIIWENMPEFSKVGEASLLLIFAFLGGEASLAVSGEMKNPRRTAPLGFFVGIISVILIFCILHLVVQGVLGEELLANQEAPLAALAKNIAGDSAFLALLVVSFIAVWSTFSSIFMLGSRIFFAGASDGLLPDVISKVHPKHKTPFVAIGFLAVLIFILALSGSFQYLLVIVTAASILLYMGVILVFFKLRLKEKKPRADIFRVPAGYWVGSFALIALGWIFYQLSSAELIAASGAVLLLIALYFLSNFVKKKIN